MFNTDPFCVKELLSFKIGIIMLSLVGLTNVSLFGCISFHFSVNDQPIEVVSGRLGPGVVARDQIAGERARR